MLEQRGIATPREMSEAIARCQLHGGDVTTSLLQFVSADETQLSAALSECYGLPAAAVGLLPGPDDATLRSFPRDVAERYCCFPLEATPGRLVLAVAHPLEPALRDELASTLGVSIEQRVALEVRIRQAQAHFYGMPLSARNQRGIARLEGDVEGAGHETPLGMWSEAQLSTLPRPPSEVSAARDSQRPPSVRPRSPTPRDGTSAVRDGLGAVRYGTSAPPPSSGTRASRRRGPMPLAQARDELGRAGTRNDVLDIFFGFASQFFEYSALFAVHNSLAEGLDAWGKGADRDTVLGIGVPLDLPSSLSEVAESCKVRLTRLGKEGIDRTLAADLQRQFNAKALVLPVSLRGRCAVLLYADNGEADVVEREIADVIAIAPDVANALGRIILQRKKEVARQKSPDNADLSSLARRSQPAAANELGQPSTEPPSLLDALEPIVNENREKSRNNARRSSRPDASAAPLRAERESGSVSAQPVVSIGPDVPSPSPPLAGDVGPRSDPNSGEDPVFLLARPQGKARLTPVPPPPRPLPVIEKPPVSITHPARVIGKGPRLPSVIVDPESADAEASERLTRAAAITRAPTQARAESSGRRPLVPQLADAPRTLSPPQYERFATRRARTDGAASAQRGARERAAQRRDQQERDARRERQDERQSYERQVAPERELERREPPPSAPDPTDAAIDAGGLAAAALADVLASPSRTALHPASVDLAEPPSVPGALLEASADEPHDESASAEEPADEDAIGATSSNAWPPPIMDHSPPPRQPPLTALVPIIIADPPKGRRGYTSRTATTARPGSRPGIKSSVQRPGSIPPIHSPAAPTVPSPARARRVEPAVAEPLPSAPQQPAPNAETPIAVSADAAAP
ncbi:MAG TPA: hypothetical protein VMG12_35040, partial [Polyangiaceae bacterium]|nr:hypothetical protein [Polyangiaceae bacterium]